MKTNLQFWSHLAEFFLEWKMFQIIVVEKIKTQFIFFSRKSCGLWDNVEKYGKGRQATDVGTALAFCKLDT